MSAMIESLRVTTEGAPVQIEGRLHTGEHFYFRARHRAISLGIGATAEEALYDSGNMALRLEGFDDDRHPLSAFADPLPILTIMLSLRSDLERWKARQESGSPGPIRR